MNLFPYPTDALKGFEEIEVDALTLDALAGEMEQSASVIWRMDGGSQAAARLLKNRAKRLRRIAACLGYIAGRLDRLHLLNEPVRRENTYRSSTQRSSS